MGVNGMFGISKRIEELFKKKLHKKQDYYINKAIESFIKDYRKRKHQDPDPATVEDLRKKLKAESIRVYAIVDNSILRERIQRAKWTFFITAIAGGGVVIVVGICTGGIVLPAIVVTFFGASTAYIATLVTIPISYNQRIRGAMNSTVATFIENMDNPPQLNEKENEINEIKDMLIKCISRIDQLELDEKSLESMFTEVDPSKLEELKSKALNLLLSQMMTNDTKQQQNQAEIDALKLAVAELIKENAEKDNEIKDLNQKVDMLYKMQSNNNPNKIDAKTHHHNILNKAKKKKDKILHKLHLWHKNSDEKTNEKCNIEQPVSYTRH